MITYIVHIPNSQYFGLKINKHARLNFTVIITVIINFDPKIPVKYKISDFQKFSITMKKVIDCIIFLSKPCAFRIIL